MKQENSNKDTVSVGFQNFLIGSRQIGTGNPCFIIAEIGQAHDGSLGTAHAYIDAVARAGADAVKFQTHIAEYESSYDEPWRVRFSYQDEFRFDYWKRMEFSKEEWVGLKKHAEEKGLFFISSPFSVEAVTLLRDVGVPLWKIASGEMSNWLLLDEILKTDLPILLSTGMGSIGEIDRTIEHIKRHENEIAIMQCTSEYPCPPERIGLNLINIFKERYSCPIGLSDHSGSIYTSIAAVTLGATLIEVHAVFSRECFGPDVASSLTIDELTEMVKGIRQIEKSLYCPVDKDDIFKESSEIRRIFNKSLAYKKNMKKGEILLRDNLLALKPSTGLPVDDLKRHEGRQLARDVKKGTFVQEVDFVGGETE